MALVSGGAGGLASALVEALGTAGYAVLAPGRDELNVADPARVAVYFTGLDRVDLLVCNAGLIADAPMSRMTEDEWSRVVEVNLGGAARCARAALPGMLERGAGHIVTVGSWSAWRPGIGQAAYAAAKAGLVGLTQTLAIEGGPRGVRANCVLPGFMDTPMTRRLPPAVVETARACHLLGRFNTTEDAARFVVFLDSLSHVSGQVFQLDSRLRRQF